jgi:hypothetical protein
MNPVDHPPHYQNASGIEAIEICEHMNFCLGNAFKYLYRRGSKGAELQDLEKALWYVRREIEGPKLNPHSYDRDMYAKAMTVARYEPVESVKAALTRLAYVACPYNPNLPASKAVQLGELHLVEYYIERAIQEVRERQSGGEAAHKVPQKA